MGGDGCLTLWIDTTMTGYALVWHIHYLLHSFNLTFSLTVIKAHIVQPGVNNVARVPYDSMFDCSTADSLFLGKSLRLYMYRGRTC